MSILVKKSGFLATFQDLGRFGFRRSGINPNGAMDKKSVRSLNILLGNDEGEAVLEMHFPAPVLEFTEEALFAIGGADFGAKLDDQVIEISRPTVAKKGQHLHFSTKKFGNRQYLAITGGFSLERWLQSASTNLLAGIGGFNGRSLIVGDEIKFERSSHGPKVSFNYSLSSSPNHTYHQLVNTIRMIAGAEFDFVTGWSAENLLKHEFIITRELNRMGYRLSGQPLFLLDKLELVSSAVDFGTIQLLPDGQLIILMADHQTAGGYPRIGHVVSSDLPKLGQLGANDRIKFELISIEEAEELIVQDERDFEFLKFAVAEKKQNTEEL